MHSSSPAGQAHELLSQFHAFPACRGNKLSRWSSLPIRLPLSSPRSSCLADSALEDKTSALLALTSTASTIWRNACALDISDQGLWAALVVSPPQRLLPCQLPKITPVVPIQLRMSCPIRDRVSGFIHNWTSQREDSPSPSLARGQGVHCSQENVNVVMCFGSTLGSSGTAVSEHPASDIFPSFFLVFTAIASRL